MQEVRCLNVVVRRKVSKITVTFQEKKKGAASPFWAMQMVTRNQDSYGAK